MTEMIIGKTDSLPLADAEAFEESPEFRTFRALGEALLRPALRTNPGLSESDVRSALLAVMAGFARTERDPEASGSVCTDFASLELPEEELEPVFKALEEATIASPMEGASAFSEGGEFRPIVIDREGRRLYFERRFADEMAVARAAARFASLPRAGMTEKEAAALKDFMREDAETNRADPDHDAAVEGALRNRFTVITGGPGTGKTTAVVRILACLLAENPNLVIAGSAPTGKASANLQESIEGAAARMAEGESPLAPYGKAVQRANLRCQTLHRWLSDRSGGAAPSARNPLPVDVLVVDECSMMDIDLARRLFSAVSPETTRLILLGDKDQLAAVGPGSVFADLSDKSGALGPWIFEFTRSHRFSDRSRLYRLAKAVTPKTGESDANAVFGILREDNAPDDNEIRWEARGGETHQGVTGALRTWLESEYGFLFEALKDGALPFAEAEPSPELLRFWDQVDAIGCLSSVHAGVNGTDAVNAFMEGKARAAAGAAPSDLHYPGRLVMVTRNSRSLDLANGDVGIELPDGSGGKPEGTGKGLAVWFGARKKRVPAVLLPEHESAFAITIHKSQGSSYRHLAVCLPGGRAGSRELFYTAVTRLADSRENGKTVYGQLRVFAAPGAVVAAVSRKMKRFGGLAERLRLLIGEGGKAAPEPSGEGQGG